MVYSVITIMEKTTIVISGETRDELKGLGKKGESYDTIIKDLLKKWTEMN